jgi:hypothetical protein
MNKKTFSILSIYFFAFAVGMVCSLLVNQVSVWLAVAVIVAALLASGFYYWLSR